MIGRSFRVTGKRGDAKRYVGFVGICTWVGDDEGRGNRHSVTITQRIALRCGDREIVVAASQCTEVTPYPHTLTSEQFAIVSVALDGYVERHKGSEHRAAIDELRKLWAFAGPIVLNARQGGAK